MARKKEPVLGALFGCLYLWNIKHITIGREGPLMRSDPLYITHSEIMVLDHSSSAFFIVLSYIYFYLFSVIYYT
jgi:hypothetical protein